METEHIVEGMNPDLREAYERIRALLAKATQDEARSRHAIGLIVSEIKLGHDKYGAQAVEQLARALVTNVHTLYRCASVAECWSNAQLEALQRRPNAHGQPLAWSHLVLISNVPSPKRRAELVERALAEGMSVRDLSILIDEGPSVTKTKGSALTVLHRVVRTAERWSQAAAEMNSELLAELEGSSRVRGGSAQVIERAIAAQEQLRLVVERQLQRLKTEKARLSKGERDASPRLLAGMAAR